MGLLGTAAKVAVASSVHGRVQRRQRDRWAAQDAAAAPAPHVPAAPVHEAQVQATPVPPAQDDILARLTQLGQLRASGVLTEAEFEAQKARILGG